MYQQTESGKCGERRTTKRSCERCALQMSSRSRSWRSPDARRWKRVWERTKGWIPMESDRRLNRWGLTFTPTVINRLRKLAIYGQPQLSLEHQGRAKRYVVRGVESGGATDDVGYYVSFAGENGEPRHSSRIRANQDVIQQKELPLLTDQLHRKRGPCAKPDLLLLAPGH